eukprot:jgi/Mesvir1/19467/Mv10491-RA.1
MRPPTDADDDLDEAEVWGGAMSPNDEDRQEGDVFSEDEDATTANDADGYDPYDIKARQQDDAAQNSDEDGDAPFPRDGLEGFVTAALELPKFSAPTRRRSDFSCAQSAPVNIAPRNLTFSREPPKLPGGNAVDLTPVAPQNDFIPPHLLLAMEEAEKNPGGRAAASGHRFHTGADNVIWAPGFLLPRPVLLTARVKDGWSVETGDSCADPHAIGHANKLPGSANRRAVDLRL